MPDGDSVHREINRDIQSAGECPNDHMCMKEGIPCPNREHCQHVYKDQQQKEKP